MASLYVVRLLNVCGKAVVALSHDRYPKRNDHSADRLLSKGLRPGRRI